MPSEWTRIHNPSKRGDSHRLARHEDGRISILDYSGATPDATDDGPLIVQFGTIVTVEYGKYGISYSVPVWCERGARSGCVHVSTETMRALAALPGLGLRATRSPSFVALCDEVFFAGLLSPAYG